MVRVRSVLGGNMPNHIGDGTGTRPGYDPGTSFSGTGADIVTVPRRQCRGDTGGLACGVVGAVKFPLVPAIDMSTLEPDRVGGADPDSVHVKYLCLPLFIITNKFCHISLV